VIDVIADIAVIGVIWSLEIERADGVVDRQEVWGWEWGTMRVPSTIRGANLGVKHTGASVGGLNRIRSVMYE
jgi:hypothetical protein